MGHPNIWQEDCGAVHNPSANISNQYFIDSFRSFCIDNYLTRYGNLAQGLGHYTE